MPTILVNPLNRSGTTARCTFMRMQGYKVTDMYCSYLLSVKAPAIIACVTQWSECLLRKQEVACSNHASGICFGTAGQGTQRRDHGHYVTKGSAVLKLRSNQLSYAGKTLPTSGFEPETSA
jgi:hypothetical protein